MPDFDVVHLSAVEPSGPGGVVRFIRRELGCEAFGINHFELPPNAAGFEHSEAGSGQEEVLFVVRGSGHWLVDGSEVPVSEGSFVRIAPAATRQPVAGPEGLTFVAVGAPRGSYEARGPF
jgi:mannose-6-phosphate isomerase-like protein (cupin superfamily)